MATTDPRWVLDDLGRLALRASSRAEFFDEAALRLKRVLPFDGACWHTLDPGSDLITQHRLQDIPDRFPVLADNEYAVDDVNKFADLAAAPRKAATLSEATGGHPERSPRFRDLLTPAGIGPELRSAFVADGATWGALILVRRAGEPDFEDRDVELLSRASSLFARAVRRGLVAEATEPAPTLTPTPEPPGVVELDAGNDPIRASSTAEPLLAELSGTTPEDGLRRPGAARGGQRHADEHPDACRRATVKTPAGRWLVLHGGRMGTAPRRTGGDLPPARAPDPRRAGAAQGLRPDRPRAGGGSARPARRDRRSRRRSGWGSRPTRSTTTSRRSSRRPAPGRAASSRRLLFFGEHLPRIQERVPVGDDASFVDAPRPRGAP